MKDNNESKACSCNLSGFPKKTEEINKKISPRQIILGLIGLVAWVLLYRQLEPFSHFFAYDLLHLEPGSHLGEAVQFFVYDTPKVMLLLTLIVFLVGIIRSFFTPERTRTSSPASGNPWAISWPPSLASSPPSAPVPLSLYSSDLSRLECRWA